MVTVITNEMLSDFSDTVAAGDYVNVNLKVHKVDFLLGRFGEVAIIQAETPEGKQLRLRTSSEVILKQLRALLNQGLEFPWLLQIKRRKRYYTLAPPAE